MSLDISLIVALTRQKKEECLIRCANIRKLAEKARASHDRSMAIINEIRLRG